MAKAKTPKTKKPPKEKPAKRGRKKGEQLHLPGTAPEKNPKVHNLALDYVRARDARMDLGKEESKLKTRLLDMMHEEKLKGYEYDDVCVILTAKEDLKVKKGGVEVTE